MPAPDDILSSLTAIANEWRTLAMAWHLYLGALLVAVAAGWGPLRHAPLLLLPPLASVSILAWVTGNLFTAIVFAALAATLALARPGRTGQAWPLTGALFVLFGLVYPHFVRVDTWTAYGAVAPVGLVPCPTLAVVVGATLMWGLAANTRWTVPVIAAALFYGLTGVLHLGVALDVVLLAGAVVLVAIHGTTRVTCTPEERDEPLPGDALIADPIASLTHAITIHTPRAQVWPWLAQMGAGTRAGWYSYDALDNGGARSAGHIVPELQRLRSGMTFPALPGETGGFTLVAWEPERFLVLGWTSGAPVPLVTWTFVLKDAGAGGTRLVTRARGSRAYRFHRLPWWVARRIVPAVHSVMERRQLLGIAQRGERSDLLLDRLMPAFDIVERHQVNVAAPAGVVMAAAQEMNLLHSPLIRMIFRAREILLRATPDERRATGSLLTDMQAIGWRVLAEVPGREVVVGAVTRPWEANVTFRPLDPAAFVAFEEPGYVKIAWTLRADPVDGRTSMFRTETRAWATDGVARRRFRRYWALFSPGIIGTRRLLLGPLRREAERRARTTPSSLDRLAQADA